MMDSLLLVVCYGVLSLLMCAATCVSSNDDKGIKNRMRPTPLWKSLLIHHHRWSGYYEHDQTRYMCSMYVHSVEYGDTGTSHVSFASEGFHIEMTGFSADNVMVTFEEIHAWNKSGHFEGHTNVVFKGQFVSDFGYYKYAGNISSNDASYYGSVTLIPKGRSVTVSDHHTSQSSKLAMAIGIPVFLGIIVLTLAVYMIVWAVRKGYLRHVPWTYKSFINPTTTTKSDVEMDGERSLPQTPASTTTPTVTVEGVETAAVHM